jgi:hypothetical protein
MNLEPFTFRHCGAQVAAQEAPAGDTLALINQFALRPLSDEDVAVFALDLCHNRVDRHFSRFPDEELEKISALVPGRPLMERHDLRGSLPRGTFFRSGLRHEDDKVTVRPHVYVLRTQDNDGFIRNIEGGVYRDTSIGFSFKTPECSVCNKDLRTCDHIPGRTYGDAACHYVMRNVVEVLEGSVVAAGSQGTRFVQEDRTLPLDAALDRARRAYHEPYALTSPVCWADE